MRFSMFRESADGPVSMRRVLALFFAVCAVPLGVFPLAQKPESWVVFIPFGISVGACMLLLFFTTWADIKAIVAAVKGGS